MARDKSPKRRPAVTGRTDEPQQKQLPALLLLFSSSPLPLCRTHEPRARERYTKRRGVCVCVCVCNVAHTDVHPHEGNVASLPRGSGATVSLLSIPRFPHQPPISRRRSTLLNLLPTHNSADLLAHYVLVQWLPLT